MPLTIRHDTFFVRVCVLLCMCFSVSPIWRIDCFQWHVSVYIGYVHCTHKHVIPITRLLNPIKADWLTIPNNSQQSTQKLTHKWCTCYKQKYVQIGHPLCTQNHDSSWPSHCSRWDFCLLNIICSDVWEWSWNDIGFVETLINILYFDDREIQLPKWPDRCNYDIVHLLKYWTAQHVCSSSNQFRFSFNSRLDGERASALDNDAKLRAKKKQNWEQKNSKIESKKTQSHDNTHGIDVKILIDLNKKIQLKVK